MVTATVLGHWQWDHLQVWQLPHTAGTRGEPQARQVLAPVLGLAPEQLPISRSERGRPQLGRPLEGQDVGWSHSGGHLLVALGQGVRLRHPLVRFVRCRTVAKVLSIGFDVRMCFQCSAG